MQMIHFNSAELAGDERTRKECWVDSLSSGYVRLQADASPDLSFRGQLNILQLGQTAIGRISATVKSISRTAAEIAAENTDNAVLLLNSDHSEIAVEQKGKSISCARGAGVLIEQCEPSFIKMGSQHDCSFVAIQLPRRHFKCKSPAIEDRFMTSLPNKIPALALARAYVDTLLQHTGALAPEGIELAGRHLTDLIAAAVAFDRDGKQEAARGSRSTRYEVIKEELDRSFTEPEFSVRALARRLAVSPRYIQAILSERGSSFTDELTERRLMKAYHLLSSPSLEQLNVMEIAFECGFSTVAHFHRIFRHRFGETPGNVRKKAPK